MYKVETKELHEFSGSIEEYLQNILDLWTHFGRQPKYAEVVKPLSKYNISSYENKFGSWRAALEKFIEFVNSGNDTENNTDDTTSQIVELKETAITKIEDISIPFLISKEIATFSPG